MPTQRVEIGPKHIEDAKEAGEAKNFTSRDPLIFADVVEKGLQLRVQGGTVSWILKFNGSSKGLGKIAELKTAKAARERAAHVRALMRRGESADEYLRSFAVSKDHAKAVADVESRKARAEGAWTWKELAEAYLAEYLSQPKATKASVKPPSKDSVKDYKRYTGTQHHQKYLDDVLVKDITPELIEKVRDLARDSNGLNAGRKVVQWISSSMSWGQEHHKGKTGLGIGFAWWKAVSPRHVPTARSRYLTLEQIARVLYIAEKYKELPGRKQKKEVSEAALSALWWIVLTAQRTSASMNLLRSMLVPDRETAGWIVAAFPAEDMKSKRYHALPIPPRVALLFERAKIGVERDSAWAFPSKKVRRPKSDQIEDLHIHDGTVNLLIRRLRGKDPVSVKIGASDLLEGIPHFSPHDLRRSLATILSDMMIEGAAASAVLDHSSETPDRMAFQEADITRMVYNRSQRLSLKRKAMEAWTEAVFEAVEMEWKRNRPKGFDTFNAQQRTLARVKDVSLGLPFDENLTWYQLIERRQPEKRNLEIELRKREQSENEENFYDFEKNTSDTSLK
ncbi:tyrosine-type recombinase/integrase [Endobacterium cereale]|uniref:tyrosine-type recombinase/integrase n=1 Tax=Endobacterium cereale TaxID=2663029 RepID=UPI002B494D01|nr:integrase arm-type DNA-binding domain-containing protein [Endobacterium cereale]MEB2846802.1 integrase arm-type DNA-binding domain-containing protein [Endobacterium cereale]